MPWTPITQAAQLKPGAKIKSALAVNAWPVVVKRRAMCPRWGSIVELRGGNFLRIKDALGHFLIHA